MPGLVSLTILPPHTHESARTGTGAGRMPGAAWLVVGRNQGELGGQGRGLALAWGIAAGPGRAEGLLPRGG